MKNNLGCQISSSLGNNIAQTVDCKDNVWVNNHSKPQTGWQKWAQWSEGQLSGDAKDVLGLMHESPPQHCKCWLMEWIHCTPFLFDSFSCCEFSLKYQSNVCSLLRRCTFFNRCTFLSINYTQVFLHRKHFLILKIFTVRMGSANLLFSKWFIRASFSFLSSGENMNLAGYNISKSGKNLGS